MYKGLKIAIQILGMKNRKWLQANVLPDMVKALENMGITIHCEVCVGGLGLQPTRLLKNPKKVLWIINDKDSEKENLYKTIRDCPLQLESACYDILATIQSMIDNNVIHKDDKYLDVQQNILKQIKIDLQEKKCTNEIIDTSIMMLQNCHSARGTTYTIEQQRKSFHKKANNICPISHIFKEYKSVVITCEDLLVVIKKYMRNINVVLWIDPPYYLSNGKYPENLPEWEYHNEIYNLLIKAKCKFVLFLRINASRTTKDINNKAIDVSLKSFYDNRYKGKNFYYIDIPVKHGYGYTIERVITNFKFNGCIKY